MKKYLVVILLPLAACGNNEYEETLVQEADFEVSLLKEDETVTAELTYTGDGEHTEISYGSDLFLFHLTSDDNDVDEGTMIDTLSQNVELASGESITEEIKINEITREELAEGSYTIEAEARFTDEDGESREIPVDKTFSVEER
jgi:hypothetical protein